jgi:hypothetical protein
VTVGSLRDRLLTIFGDIKVFKHPLFLVYDPGGYRVRGRDLRCLVDLLQPGDVLVRGFSAYLDGKLIPGHFSHAALYLGKTVPADLELVPPAARGRFVAGEQVVIHAVAEGVLMEDILDFGRCDRIAVLRFPARIVPTPGAPVDDAAPLDEAERALRAKLLAGGVTFAEAWPVLRRVALAQLGRGYDFDFDFTDVKRLSCTELVHRATRALAPFLGVAPREHRILFLRGTGIAPDAWVSSPLDLAWASPSTRRATIERLRRREAPAVRTAWSS